LRQGLSCRCLRMGQGRFPLPDSLPISESHTVFPGRQQNAPRQTLRWESSRPSVCFSYRRNIDVRTGYMAGQVAGMRRNGSETLKRRGMTGKSLKSRSADHTPYQTFKKPLLDALSPSGIGSCLSSSRSMSIARLSKWWAIVTNARISC
jgi:hypothetical protein